MVALRSDDHSKIKNKRFLITQSSLRSLAGSEINTLELATYLQDQGAHVTVYTYFFSEPISRYFHEKNIRVITDEARLDLDDFDYVWVHHQVIPYTFISKLSNASHERIPDFIFLHMSGLETHYLEQSHIWRLEENIASKVLFVSDESMVMMHEKSLSMDKRREGFYRNPTPVSFSDIKHAPNSKLNNILIVSNHPALEITEAVSILRKQGYKVVMSGEGQDAYGLIEPAYLNEFDVVVTIGKTVQYCLVEGVPVYVYDIWGGPGYLGGSTFEVAKWSNFSGRGFKKKQAETIVKEIIGGYPDAIEYQTDTHREFVKEFSMGSIIPEIIAHTESRKIQPFETHYVQFLTGILMMLKYKFYHENLLIIKESETKFVQKALENAARELVDAQRVIDSKDRQIKSIYKSRTYKLGRFLLWPVRFVVSLLAS